ncbi:MAG: hypothetical protein ABIG90_01565 [bacterium]
MPEILEELFNSKTRAKVLKLMFRNPENGFRVKAVSERAKVDYFAARRELDKLKAIKIVNYRNKAFVINPDFDFYNELKNLVLRSTPVAKEKILKQLKKIGKLKLIILSGVFVNTDNTRVDLFMVGEVIHKRKLETLLKNLEAEVGKEIDYVIMDSSEFRYRKNMFDKFVLEMLEGPKQILLDRVGIE